MTRADCYRLLSALFHPPERSRLLDERICPALAEALNALCPGSDAAAHAETLETHLAEASDLDLRVDHAALFVGPFALKAPPYGSVYLERDHLLMGETTRAAAACYAEAGLAVALREPPDHIAVELEFMHYLAALRLDDQRQRFLTEHLGAWTPAFCAAVQRSAGTRFYRTLAACLGAFLEAEMGRATPAGFEPATSTSKG